MPKKYITVTSDDNTTPINTSTQIGGNFKLNSVTVHFSAAPITSENFTITLDANDGSVYDTLIFSVDPSASAVTDIVFTPDKDLKFEAGDEIKVEFPNTDANTYALRIVTQSL